MKKLLFILFVLAVALPSQAQQESLHSQLFDNHYWQNPAAAGASDYHKLRLNYRLQWMKMIGSPRTATISYNGAFRRIGIGARLQYDIISSFERINAELAYAYHLPLSEKLTLSFGLNLKYANYRLVNSQYLGLVNQTDVAVVNGQKGSHVFETGAGLYLYSDRFFAGVSAINLIQWKLDFGDDTHDSQARIYRQYQAMVGYRFDFGKVSFTPSAYFRMVQAAPPQVDINMRLGFLDDQLFTGLTYRTTTDFAVFLGCQLNESIYLAYSYDFSASSLQRFTAGSHEVTVGVDIIARKERPKKGEVESEKGKL